MNEPILVPIAEVVSDPQSRRNLAPWFRGLSWGLGGFALLLLAQGVFWMRLVTADFGDDYEAFESAAAHYGQLFMVLQFCAAVSVAACLFGMWFRQRRGRLGAISAVALGLFVFEMALMVAWRVVDSAAAVDLLSSPAVRILSGLITPCWIGLVAMLACRSMGRKVHAEPLVWLVGIALGFHTAWDFVNIASGPLVGRDQWLSFFVSAGPLSGALFLVSALAWRVSSRVDEATSRSATLGGGAWAPAHRGIALYGAALTWRLGLTMVGFFLLLLMATSGSAPRAKFALLAIPLVSLVTGLAMTIGVFRFAQQPAQTRGHIPATFAGVLMAIALLLDLVMVVGVSNGINGGGGYQSARSASMALESATSLGGWAMVLGFVAFLALLSSFHRVARALGEADIAARCVGIAIAVVACGALAVLLRLTISGAGRAQSSVLGFGFFALLAIVVVIVAYLRLVNRLSQRLAREASCEPTNEYVEPRSV